MKRLLFALLAFYPVASWSQEAINSQYRSRLDLKGVWEFAIDTANTGERDQWYLRTLDDNISLPGTMDLNQKGKINRDTTTMHLNRMYVYEGAAWYRRKVSIPAGFAGQHTRLVLERAKSTTVWIDSIKVGSSALLQSPQEFDVSPYLTPGDHFITIKVNNSLRLTPYGNVHIYSDDTQTNWNGIIGQLFAEASAPVFISDLQVYPDISNRKARVRLAIQNAQTGQQVTVKLIAKLQKEGAVKQLRPVTQTVKMDTVISIDYPLDQDCHLWDEYQQPLYELTASISMGKIKDDKRVRFGMRQFDVKGTHFAINGRTCFLRGKHDACVFPLTGHPPMDAEGWSRVFNIAKSYGINHYRFHSYCPPEAAFIAADQAGIYLQAELPFWGGLESDSVATQLREEGIAMLKHYANHPSFVMFSHGNELWGGHVRAEKNILALKQYDKRPLYTLGSNVNIGYYAPTAGTDFFVGARTPSSGDTILTHTRLTHAFPDSRKGGIFNTRWPSTLVKFSHPVSQLRMPIISHEIGQYQVYPDYSELPKYTGILKPRNLEVFRERLRAAGMLDQASDFQKASGAWAALCYKAEMEAALRTKGFGGFQLLDLQDFPGQGTALVGILDAFMDSKNVIGKQAWLQSCNDVVVLAMFSKYSWVNTEKFEADVQIANYSNREITGPVRWELRGPSGIIGRGILSGSKFQQGDLTKAGVIEIPLKRVQQAEKLELNISLTEDGYSNNYPIWVYPGAAEAPDAKEVFVTSTYNEEAKQVLANGGKVLLFPEGKDVKEHSLEGLFPPEFWNWEMFKNISASVKKPASPGTLGLLMNPAHPLFRSFPTDNHTNWQWFSIIKASRPFILDSTPASYRPVVQVIDNLQRNHKLGLIFEARSGKGKLLVCMAALPKLAQYAEAAQLYRSILAYMQSSEFQPTEAISAEVSDQLR